MVNVFWKQLKRIGSAKMFNIFLLKSLEPMNIKAIVNDCPLSFTPRQQSSNYLAKSCNANQANHIIRTYLKPADTQTQGAIQFDLDHFIIILKRLWKRRVRFAPRSPVRSKGRMNSARTASWHARKKCSLPVWIAKLDRKLDCPANYHQRRKIRTGSVKQMHIYWSISGPHTKLRTSALRTSDKSRVLVLSLAINSLDL